MARKAAAARVNQRTDYRILLDAPARNPELGYPDIASALAGIVMESEPHFAIGIFGKWGSGKTTLMDAVEARLDAAHAIPVRFVAWRYEREEHLIVPLLDTIRDALLAWSDEADESDAVVSRETAGKIGRVLRAIVAGTSVKIGVPGAISVSFDANKALGAGDEMSREDAEARVPRSFYHASYAALRDAFTVFAGPNTDRRIVVFIDDLDRCLPESALQVIESMKLFFDLDGFVFVVGLDRAIVQEVVNSKFRSADDGVNGDGSRNGTLVGEDYIKKIFQVPYELAPVAVNQLGDFLRSAYDEAGLPESQRTEFRSVVEPHLPFLLSEGSVNPREMKRYLNAYTITMKIHPELESNAVLAVLMLDFRADWERCESALLLNGDVFVDALRRLHGGEADALDDIGLDLRLPDEFVSYTQQSQPGNALLNVNDIERYILNVGTARPTRDSDILVLLPRVGSVKRSLATLKGSPQQAKSLLGPAHSALSSVSSALSRSSAPLAVLILRDVAQFTTLAQQLEKQAASVGEGPGGAESWADEIGKLEELVRQISSRLLALYHAPPGAPPQPDMAGSAVPAA
jgi:KAP family P-loop domain